MIKRYCSNVFEGKAVYFFFNKVFMHEIYDTWFKDDPIVVMVDADADDDEKLKVFQDFENVTSTTRVIMGTKLISNGLDCPIVNHVCLVNGMCDCIDYLQMVGRIRGEGLVTIVHDGRANRRYDNNEILENLPLILTGVNVFPNKYAPFMISKINVSNPVVGV